MLDFKTIGLDAAELKFASDDAGTFSGYASVFGGVDTAGDTVHPGAFSRIASEMTEVKMYFNHGWQRGEIPIGKMFVQQDSRGLRVDRGEFTRGMQKAEEVILAAKHGTVTGLSIGYTIDPGKNPRKSGAKGRELYEIHTLKEVSVVDYPADQSARILDMKSEIDEISDLKQAEAFLRDVGGLSWASAKALVSQIKSVALRDGDAEATRLAARLAETFQRFRA